MGKVGHGQRQRMVGFGFGRINEMTRWLHKSGLIQYADCNRMSQNDLELEFSLKCHYFKKSNLIWQTCMSQVSIMVNLIYDEWMSDKRQI
jgi:hypothetical protein